MDITWNILRSVIYLVIVNLCDGLPVDLVTNYQGTTAESIAILIAVIISVCIIIVFVGCVCCQRRNGFKPDNKEKVFRDSSVSASVICETGLSNDPGHVNPIASPEFTIFTPLSPSHHNNNVFRSSQPITSVQNDSTGVIKNSNSLDNFDLSHVFDGSQNNLSRSKLKYIRELGTGWFGRVVEGEAFGIKDDQCWTPVAVRILEASATAHEQSLFLHEIVMYKIKQPHSFVLRLLGYSLEAAPLLLIQEYCHLNLKKFLQENRTNLCSSVLSELLLKFCCQIASALQYLHDNNIPHMDLATRNCQISLDNSIKLGDYGLSVNQYPEDYYQGVPAVPVRWCAPETLNHTTTTLQPKPMTCEGNIWSFGVIMWEICEFGAQPYSSLTDDEVVSQVLGPPHIRLSSPTLNSFYVPHLYHLMRLCWSSVEKRPVIQQIYGMLVHLLQFKQQNDTSKSPSKQQLFSTEDFDERWKNLKPNTIVKTDKHVSSSDADVVFYEKVTEVSSVSSISDFTKEKSASLTNLHGSFDNLLNNVDDTNVVNAENQLDSWLQNVATHTGDMQYVQGLSQAIKALDSALASEQTSSSTSSYPSPDPEQWTEETANIPEENTKVEFKLGLNNPVHVDAMHVTLDVESDSETEDETWKKRVEKGVYSEKVRMKSKSVTDLMILTHIDCSDTDSETPFQSLEYRQNTYKNVRLSSKYSFENAATTFGSEGNLLTVQDTFQQELRKLQEERRDSLLFVPTRSSSANDVFAQLSDCDKDLLRNKISKSVLMSNKTNIDLQHKTQNEPKSLEIKAGNNEVVQEFAEITLDSNISKSVREENVISDIKNKNDIKQIDENVRQVNVDNDNIVSLKQIQSDTDPSHYEDTLEEASLSSGIKSDDVLDSQTKTDSAVFKSELSSEDSDYNSVSLTSNEYKSRTLNLDSQVVSTDETFVKVKINENLNNLEIKNERDENINGSEIKDKVFTNIMLAENSSNLKIKNENPEIVMLNENSRNLEIKYETLVKVILDENPSDLNIKDEVFTTITLAENSSNLEIKGIQFDKTTDETSEKASRDKLNTDLTKLNKLTEDFLHSERYHVSDVNISEKLSENTIKKAQPSDSMHITNLSFLELEALSNAPNIQSVNQVYNVFNVMIDSPSIDLYSILKEPVKLNEVDKVHRMGEFCCDNQNNFTNKLEETIIKDINSSATTKINQQLKNGIKDNAKENILINEITQEIKRSKYNPLKLSEIILRYMSIDLDSCRSLPKKINGHSLDFNIFQHSNDLRFIESESYMNDPSLLDTTKQQIQIKNEPIKEIKLKNPSKLSDIVMQKFPECSYDNKNEKLNSENNLELSDVILKLNMSIPDKSSVVTYDDDIKDRSAKKNYNPLKLSEIILRNDKNSLEGKSDSFDEHIDVSIGDELKRGNLFSSTPCMKRFHEFIQKEKMEDNILSFVSAGDEHIYPTVILGPCEDHTLGLYSGLKTTFENYDDRSEEEVLQFSSNFIPFENDLDNNISDSEMQNPYQNIGPFVHIESSNVDYSLETWDKFLGKSFDDEDENTNAVFDSFSPNHNLDKTIEKHEEISNESFNKTNILMNNHTFEIPKINETVVILKEIDENISSAESKNIYLHTKIQNDTFVKDAEDLENSSNWEPGEGWYLHPLVVLDDLTGQIDVNTDVGEADYSSFVLDEDSMNALRNELAAKLPHAQRRTTEEEQEPFDSDCEERSEIVVKYNVYTTPLSPIPEESCCDDIYCDQTQNRDTDSDSDWSEPGLGHTSQLEEDILVIDTENHTALILESPSLQEPQRHTPSQDSCCSNDTLFNLEDLNYGLIENEQSPVHVNNSRDNSPLNIELEIHEEQDGNSTVVVEPAKTEINIEDHSTIENSMELVSEIENEKTVECHKLELKFESNVPGVAPLPSPEDIPWRQLPASLLTYSQIAQDKFDIDDNDKKSNGLNIDTETEPKDLKEICCLNNDLYSNLTDIRFSGPCDTQLMSTSFSESNDFQGERDWDSGSDTRSSSSGEFIWKEGEHEESLRALHAASHDVGVVEDINPLDVIEEENSDSSNESDDGEDIEESEFVPSAWDAQATPTKSALRSPEKSNKCKNNQKGVWFKKQKYHCIYEYPREPESPIIQAVDLWRPYSNLPNYSDWDVNSCLPNKNLNEGYDTYLPSEYYQLPETSVHPNGLYQLNSYPEFSAGPSNSDEDFYISSSAKPFQSLGQVSQFFPGQDSLKTDKLWRDYHTPICPRTYSENVTPDSGVEDVTPASGTDYECELKNAPVRNIQTLKSLAAQAANKLKPDETKNQDSLGGLRHTRNRLKLDLPPSPNSFTSNKTFSIELNNDPVVSREVPTFTTFGKSRFLVQHVPTPTEDEVTFGKPKSKNVSFEALPHKPIANDTSLRLGTSLENKHKAVEMVRGEASLLDSADEDSGIESSANATLERQVLN